MLKLCEYLNISITALSTTKTEEKPVILYQLADLLHVSAHHLTKWTHPSI
jgi:hypothetical protein